MRRERKWMTEKNTERKYIGIFKKYFIVVQLQLSAFSPHHTLHPSQTHLPLLLPPWPLVLSMCPLPYCSWKPFPPLSPCNSPLVTIRLFNFNVSGYILLAFFLMLITFQLKEIRGESYAHMGITIPTYTENHTLSLIPLPLVFETQHCPCFLLISLPILLSFCQILLFQLTFKFKVFRIWVGNALTFSFLF